MITSPLPSPLLSSVTGSPHRIDALRSFKWQGTHAHEIGQVMNSFLTEVMKNVFSFFTT